MGERYSELREAVGLDCIAPTTEDVFKLRLWEEKPLTGKDTISYNNRLGTNLKEPFVCEGSYFIETTYLYKIEIHPDENGFCRFHLEYADATDIKNPTIVNGRIEDYGREKRCKLHKNIGKDEIVPLIIGRAFYNLMLFYYNCGICEYNFERRGIDFGNVEVVEKVVKLSNKVYAEGRSRKRDDKCVGTKHSKHAAPRFHIRRYSNGKYVFVGDPNGQIIVHVYKL